MSVRRRLVRASQTHDAGPTTVTRSVREVSSQATECVESWAHAKGHKRPWSNRRKRSSLLTETASGSDGSAPRFRSHDLLARGKGSGDIRRSTGRLGICVTVAVGTLLLGAQPALADSSGNASCMGIEASAISPPGISDEFPGGAAELMAFIRDLADQLGVPPGAIVKFIAQLHEGSHEACDEAIEG